MSRPTRPVFTRKCVAPGCTVDFGTEGTLPHCADVHWGKNGALVISCSRPCREALGLPERKRGAA